MTPGDVAIVGAAETDEIGVLPHMSVLELHAQASLRAISDAGLTPDDINGIATARPFPVAVADRLGIKPRWLDGTAVGGISTARAVRNAVWGGSALRDIHCAGAPLPA